MFTKLTLGKCFNILNLLMSYYWSKWIKQNKHAGYPTSMSIEPTTTCNLRCPECPSGLRSFSRPTGNLDPDFFEKLVNEVSPFVTYMQFYFQGEPFLHPQLLKMVKYASQKKIYTATSTNAHFLSKEVALKTVESGLDRIIISIDGTDQKTYEAYRKGGKLKKVIEGTKNLIDAKKALGASKPFVVFQFLVVKPNELQIDEVKKLAKEIGVDEVKLKTAQIYDYKKGNPLIPVNEKYSRYVKDSEGTYHIKNKLFNQCWKMWQGCVVTWDGTVVPCCFDKDASNPLGSLKDQTFKQIWNSPSYSKFRSSLLQSRKNIEICANCSEGTKVWV